MRIARLKAAERKFGVGEAAQELQRAAQPTSPVRARHCSLTPNQLPLDPPPRAPASAMTTPPCRRPLQPLAPVPADSSQTQSPRPVAQPKERKERKPRAAPAEPLEKRKSGRIVGLKPIHYGESALEDAERRAARGEGGGGGGKRGKQFVQSTEERCVASPISRAPPVLPPSCASQGCGSAAAGGSLSPVSHTTFALP